MPIEKNQRSISMLLPRWTSSDRPRRATRFASLWSTTAFARWSSARWSSRCQEGRWRR